MTYLSRGAFLPICINYNSKNDKKLYVLTRKAEFVYSLSYMSLQGHIAFLIEWKGVQSILSSV